MVRMEMVVTIRCSCGNKETYNVEHSKIFDKIYLNLSESIDDIHFFAVSTMNGTEIVCRECKNKNEVI